MSSALMSGVDIHLAVELETKSLQEFMRGVDTDSNVQLETKSL